MHGAKGRVDQSFSVACFSSLLDSVLKELSDVVTVLGYPFINLRTAAALKRRRQNFSADAHILAHAHRAVSKCICK